MEKKGFINKFFQNAGKPEGFLGRMILRGMNKGHAPLSRWARSCLVWQPEWNTLDIGCGGGANLSEILKLCPQGKVHGIDISQESVAFARKKNMAHVVSWIKGVPTGSRMQTIHSTLLPLSKQSTSGVIFTGHLLK